MKVSASILATKGNYVEYAEQLKYANVDCLHIDIFQNDVKFSLKDISKINDIGIPLDVHLIFEEITEEDIDILNKSKVAYVSIQYEKLRDKSCINYLSKKIRSNFGLAFTIQTPLEVFERHIDLVSYVLFMCSEPGISGATFDDRNYERILEVHTKYPYLKIYADGGIDGERAERLRLLGVSMVVSGTFLCRDMERLNWGTCALKYHREDVVTVKKLMLPLASIPIVQEETGFVDLLVQMNKYRLGMVFVVKEKNKLVGIVSSGDIRRGILKYGKEIFEKKAVDILNENPYVVTEDMFVEKIYEDISKLHKGINVIPVVEDGNVLVGAIDLQRGV